MEDKDKPTSEKVEELLIWASNTQKNFDKPIKSLWERIKETKPIKYPPTQEQIEKSYEWLKYTWNGKERPAFKYNREEFSMKGFYPVGHILEIDKDWEPKEGEGSWEDVTEELIKDKQVDLLK